MTSGRITAVNRAGSTRMTSISNLPNLKWWVEPSGIVSGDATNIDSWTDGSSSAFNVAETGTNRPTIASTVLNGFNGAQFVSANHQRLKLANTRIVSVAGNGISVGLIVRFDATSGSSVNIAWGNTDVAVGGFEIGSSTAGKYDFLFPNLGGQIGTTITTGAFHIVQWNQTGSSTGEFFLDGVHQTCTNVIVQGPTSPMNPGASGMLILGQRSNLSAPTAADCTIVAGYACAQYLPTTAVAFARSVWKAKYPSLP